MKTPFLAFILGIAITATACEYQWRKNSLSMHTQILAAQLYIQSELDKRNHAKLDKELESAIQISVSFIEGDLNSIFVSCDEYIRDLLVQTKGKVEAKKTCER